MQDENVESLRYYKHAMSVVKNCADYPVTEIAEVRRQSANQPPNFVLRPEQITLAVDQAKVHVSIGHLLKQFGEFNKAHDHFIEAVVSQIYFTQVCHLIIVAFYCFSRHT